MSTRPTIPSADAMNWDGLVCPACDAPLKQSSTDLACTVCSHLWPLIDNVPDFTGKYSSQVAVPSEYTPEIDRSADNLEAVNGQWLLDLPAGSKVLDLSAGIGTTAHALSIRCREVIAVERGRERIAFMRNRFAHERVWNVKPLQSSIWMLPFPKESFDLVTINNGFDEVTQGQHGNTQELQERALKKVLALLRPGGQLYLGVENRFWLGYLATKPDSTGRRSYLPAPLGRLIQWYVRKKAHTHGYRKHLYCIRGYRKLLAEAGFREIRCFVALPSYVEPRFLIPLRRHIFSYYIRNFTPAPIGPFRIMLQEVLLRLDLMKYCQHSFVLMARK